jgi:hypothetical protein
MPYPFRAVDGKTEVKLPPGSFFVRYFYNLIKKYDPFADAIKPHSKYMRYLLTHHILNPKILAILGHFVRMLYQVAMHSSPMTADELKTVSEKQAEMFRSTAARYGLSLDQLKAIQDQWDVTTAKGSIFHTILKYSVYSKDSPYRGVANAIRRILGVKYVVFGHTHQLDQDYETNGDYFNAGTWMALYVDDSDRLLRETGDVQFSFVRVLKNEGGEATVELLEWDDARGAMDRVKLLAPRVP